MGYLTLDCWGITFVKMFDSKAALPRASMFFGDLKSAKKTLEVPVV